MVSRPVSPDCTLCVIFDYVPSDSDVQALLPFLQALWQSVSSPYPTSGHVQWRSTHLLSGCHAYLCVQRAAANPDGEVMYYPGSGMKLYVEQELVPLLAHHRTLLARESGARESGASNTSGLPNHGPSRSDCE